MPSAAAHFAMAYTIEDRLRFRNNAFVYGCMLPDFIESRGVGPAKPLVDLPDMGMAKTRVVSRFDHPAKIIVRDPHYHKISRYCEVPDLARFWRETELDGMLKLGYAAHLMEDWFFLERFCPEQGLDDLSLFKKDRVYEDYTRLNPLVIDEFAIDLDRTNRVLSQDFFHIAVNKKQYWRNVDWINRETTELRWPQYIDPAAFYEFIKDAADYVIADPQFCQLARQLKIIRD